MADNVIAHLTALVRRGHTSLKEAHTFLASRAWTVGALVTLVAAIVGAIAWFIGGPLSLDCCKNQLQHRFSEHSILAQRILRVERNIETLKHGNHVKPSGANLRPMAVEADYLHSLQNQKARLSAEAGSFAPLERWPIYVMSLAASFGLALLARREHKRIFSDRHLSEDILNPWRLPWLAAWLVPTVLTWMAEALANSSPTKQWFGWDSLCISWVSFLSSQVALTGTFVAAAVPLSLFFCLFRPSRRPRYDAASPEIPSVVRDYLDALQFSALSGLIAIVGFAVLWLWIATRQTTNDTFEPIYLLPVASLILPAIVIGIMIASAHKLQGDYRTWRAGRLAKNRTEEVPPDPTIRFLGENPLKLPGTIAAVLGLAWYLLDKLGVLQVILR